MQIFIWTRFALQIPSRVEYKYDRLNRRIIEDDGTDEKDLYYSDQWQVLEERVGGDTTVQYVWSAVYVDAMILRDRDADTNTGNGLEERIYVLHDANYNVTALVETSGNVLERYYYEAYGRAVYLDDAFALLPDGQSEHAWQHLHQGGRLDTITGNYHFRHRDLSHSLGRWISQDPIGFEAGDANLYRYLGNGPIRRLDPLGTDWLDNASNFFAGWADTLTFGVADDIRNWAGVNGGVDHGGTAYGIGGAAATGVAIGAGGALVVSVGAPLLTTGGASLLTSFGVSSTTATTVSQATVTLGVFGTGVSGLWNMGQSSYNAFVESDWETLAFNGGLLIGGSLIGAGGGGRHMAEGMMGGPSRAPNTWNPIPILHYEWLNAYNPNMGLPGTSYWATCPTPFSAGATALGTTGLICD